MREIWRRWRAQNRGWFQAAFPLTPPLSAVWVLRSAAFQAAARSHALRAMEDFGAGGAVRAAAAWKAALRKTHTAEREKRSPRSTDPGYGAAAAAAPPMNIIHHARELGTLPQKVCVAIGVFDGVHLGHQQVIRQTITDAHQHAAQAVAITFDQHPNAVVAPERTPPLIYSLSQKLRVIAALGIDATLLIRFDRAFSEQPGEDFIRSLVQDFGKIYSICVGSNFTFGHRRAGNVALLKTLGQDLKFTVHGLAAVSLDGKVVSSTRIREAIRNGNVDAASQMLGRPYVIAGNIVKGDQLGRKLGFPTANLEVTGLVLPPAGVYAAHAQMQERTYQAVVNIGHRPTVEKSAPEIRVEAHLLEFNGDLYGQELELTLLDKLRAEQRFQSLDALKQQIERDIAAALNLFG